MKKKLSDRALGLAPSATLAISAKAKELKAKGEDVIGFGAGEPDFDTPANIKEAAIRAINDGKTGYTDVGGIIELKKAIVEKFKRDAGLTYEPSEIVVSCGGKHSLFNLCLAFFEPGDEVIIPAPYWVSYPPMVELSGAKPVIIYAGVEKDFKITVGDLKKAVTKKTKAIIFNSPSNPTGAGYTKEEIEKIAEFAVENEIYVISDEIYEKLIYGGFEHVSIASLGNEIKDLTIVVNGISKTYATTGWRIGYTAGPKELVSAMTRIQSQSTSNPTTISQWAAIEALSGPQDEVEKMRSTFEERRSIMIEGLNEIEGVRCNWPQGAFYAFPDVSGLYGKSHSGGKIGGSLDFASYLLSEVKVALVPGAPFGDDNCIRLSYASSIEDIMGGMKRIKEAVSRLS
ncbi:MAG: pyridoxal phosphate-dependent aminotransferase [Deltaproteobacteria bacterium]|uniref:Pyridoxal phosphate-dependent aminotransferase n=1 Tax=Candidatus Zymogenus saltonus TaxID=2844893 RepID=A0A9D8KE48_9DELT|nr:pyridoxal phosphate-dependent aminotransferase [Candidatus Zymogenus saltonus]